MFLLSEHFSNTKPFLFTFQIHVSDPNVVMYGKELGVSSSSTLH